MGSRRLCACEGKNLDRLLQPTVMALLVEGPQHGYALVDRLKDSPLMKGCKPDDTGVYRLLSLLQKQRLVRQRVAEANQQQDEIRAHEAVLEKLRAAGDCVWDRLEADSQAAK